MLDLFYFFTPLAALKKRGEKEGGSNVYSMIRIIYNWWARTLQSSYKPAPKSSGKLYLACSSVWIGTLSYRQFCKIPDNMQCDCLKDVNSCKSRYTDLLASKFPNYSLFSNRLPFLGMLVQSFRYTIQLEVSRSSFRMVVSRWFAFHYVFFFSFQGKCFSFASI